MPRCRREERLLSGENVLITPHQAFATGEALGGIAATTFQTLQCRAAGRVAPNELTHLPVARTTVP
jgi:D-lactate dehydrogenase